jgi:hypothetical protein
MVLPSPVGQSAPVSGTAQRCLPVHGPPSRADPADLARRASSVAAAICRSSETPGRVAGRQIRMRSRSIRLSARSGDGPCRGSPDIDHAQCLPRVDGHREALGEAVRAAIASGASSQEVAACLALLMLLNPTKTLSRHSLRPSARYGVGSGDSPRSRYLPWLPAHIGTSPRPAVDEGVPAKDGYAYSCGHGDAYHELTSGPRCELRRSSQHFG